MDGKLILAANIIESLQALLAPTRIGITKIKNPEIQMLAALIKTGLSGATHLSSSILQFARIGKRTNPSITNFPEILPHGTVGLPYQSYQFIAAGSSPPFTWTAVPFEGSEYTLPPGLTMDKNTGLLHGTPTEPGIWVFQIRVMDSFVGPAWGFQSKNLEIIVNQ